MKLAEIIEHMQDQGYVTRTKWAGRSMIACGMDNVCWMMQRTGIDPRKQFSKHYWTPTLDDLNAEDWIVIPYMYNGADYEPFRNGMMDLFLKPEGGIQ